MDTESIHAAPPAAQGNLYGEVIALVRRLQGFDWPPLEEIGLGPPIGGPDRWRARLLRLRDLLLSSEVPPGRELPTEDPAVRAHREACCDRLLVIQRERRWTAPPLFTAPEGPLYVPPDLAYRLPSEALAVWLRVRRYHWPGKGHGCLRPTEELLGTGEGRISRSSFDRAWGWLKKNGYAESRRRPGGHGCARFVFEQPRVSGGVAPVVISDIPRNVISDTPRNVISDTHKKQREKTKKGKNLPPAPVPQSSADPLSHASPDADRPPPSSARSKDGDPSQTDPPRSAVVVVQPARAGEAATGQGGARKAHRRGELPPSRHELRAAAEALDALREGVAAPYAAPCWATPETHPPRLALGTPDPTTATGLPTGGGAGSEDAWVRAWRGVANAYKPADFKRLGEWIQRGGGWAFLDGPVSLGFLCSRLAEGLANAQAWDGKPRGVKRGEVRL